MYKNWKLIVDTFKDETFFELYDVINDPIETTNLVFEKEKVVKELFFMINKFMKDTDDRLETLNLRAYKKFLEGYKRPGDII